MKTQEYLDILSQLDSGAHVLKMVLDFNFGSLDVKWQRLQVGYLSEKSMLTIDFLPKYHWFPGQKCLQNQ